MLPGHPSRPTAVCRVAAVSEWFGRDAELVSPLGQFCHHMFKPLPQLWQECLGPTSPVFTLNVYSMLKPYMPCVGRGDFTRQMAQFFFGLRQFRCKKTCDQKFAGLTSLINLGERRQRAVLVPSSLPTIRSSWARSVPPIVTFQVCVCNCVEQGVPGKSNSRSVNLLC